VGATGTDQPARRGVKEILLSYFYWTYPRGSFHYDIMVTLILLFIFVTPHVWNFSDKPSVIATTSHPIQVMGDGGHGVIVTVAMADANVPQGASDREVKKALRLAIEPVAGDSVIIEKWNTVTDANGNLVWKVWAHR
jgi:hypothetical protein